SVVEIIDREASRAGMLVAWGHCREAGGTPPLWPFACLVRAVIQKLALATPAQRASAALRELRELLPRLERDVETAQFTHDSGGLGNSHVATHRLFDAITRALAAAAAHTPCVLVLDDLHRADLASLKLLHYWVDELAHVPIVLVGTTRKL